MTMSDAQRAKNYRDRKRNPDGTVPIAAAPDAGGEPGPMSEALERTLSGLRDPDPVLAALARRLAAHLDASPAVNHQIAAELRRTINDLRPRSVRGAAGSGSGTGRKPGKVAQLRRDYQSSRLGKTG